MSLRRTPPDAIETARLELVPLSEPFVEAVKRGDLAAGECDLGAAVSRWLAREPAHLVQLRLAQLAADASGMEGLGRAIVVGRAGGRPRVIGTIGFHGPPDERGRLEVGCSIDPAYERRGYAGEATAALVEWAARRYGITRFVVAVPAVGEPSSPVPLEIGVSSLPSSEDALDALGL